MKKITVIFLFGILFQIKSESQEIPPSPADKSVVYFVRASGLGAAINFTYFDSTKLIGKGNGTNYVRYECEPGHHLFWARSENKDFVEAEVEAGRIYFIEVVPQMGALKAGVQLKPVDPSNEKTMKRILKIMEKKAPETFSAEELEKDAEKSKDVMERGLEKYREEKEKGKKTDRLEKEMYYKNQ